MVHRYPLKDEPGRTMFVFYKLGKVFGHIIKDRTNKEPAKLLFETTRYDSLEALQADYPAAEEQED